MRSALHEEWTEGRVLLRKCIRSGSVDFQDLRLLISELIDLWPNVRLYIRCTGLAHAKEKVDSVSISFLFSSCCVFLFGGNVVATCLSVFRCGVPTGISLLTP